MSNVKGLRLTLSKINLLCLLGYSQYELKHSFLKGEHLHKAGPLATVRMDISFRVKKKNIYIIIFTK